MRKSFVLLLMLAVVGGCSGHYVMTVPDQVAATGGENAAVMRLQRNEFFRLALAVKGTPIGFSIDGAKEQYGYTDKLGYTGTVLAAPGTPGVYTMTVSLQDTDGETASTQVPVYVFSGETEVCAVDLDCLPTGSDKETTDAVAAMEHVSRTANVIYFTRKSIRHHEVLHRELSVAGYPDGPILLWHRERWHIVREGRWPKLVVESRMVSQLPQLRKMFAGMVKGLCTSKLAAKSFVEVNMDVIMIGSGKVTTDRTTQYGSWANFIASKP